ncbi:Asp-tRNAAsn/Glu-tRNAGln amidotransferase A subunit [Austwickia chelonae]|uniref:Putative amidase n=1 Tax=Austwickia chelonae NBRC 105200 TaxID=1184607 RepID=K6V7T5_9MICO|nr:amidase family protein [Austwickia chelonae]GAB78288.1 putative amidase [Austwickia chelonae NBRC 105200]SEW00516.1 Asp-tRNAAsn/Glu-tRNAGln amidotransferase A subunit [Austwickia chelonae]
MTPVGALTLIMEAYGASFATVAILVSAITAAVFLGLYALNQKRRGRTWGKGIPALLVGTAVIVGIVSSGARVLQQLTGLQRQEGKVLTLDEDTNHFPRQTEVNMAPFDRLIDRVGESRLKEMKTRFADADMTARHQLRLKHGYTSSDMLAYYAWRMKGQDAKGNTYYRAVMELDQRAIDAAEKAGKADPNNPMHGAIVLVKGNIAVNGLVNDSGSWALADSTATSDADIVRRLRDGGAIIAGRANLSEFANYLTFGGPNGFTGRSGQTLSPQGPLTVDPLGSSTGSATAVALDYADFTVGTETSGSVLAPAGAAGVVGLKSSHDGCSISGIVPIDDRVDSVGFLGRSTRDVQLAHSIGCQPAKDSGSASPANAAAPTKIMVLGEVPQSLKDLAKKGNINIVEAPAKITELVSKVDEANPETIFKAGFGPSLEKHLRSSTGKAKKAADVTKYYEDNPDTAPYGYTMLGKTVDVDDEGRAEGQKELEKVKQIVAKVDAELRAANVDALVTSTSNLAAFSLAGVPRITVPLEKQADPVGKESPEVSFQVTAARQDAVPQVIAIAAALKPSK